MKLYTIGFTKKTAKEFFTLLKSNNVKTLVDIRLNNTSQLSGFSKYPDIKFFLKQLCDIDYIHDSNLAPTQEVLSDYKKKVITWDEYEKLFKEILDERNSDNQIINEYKKIVDGMCLLCSEPKANMCHRRLVAEYIKKELKNTYNIEIVHL
ncbi:DUF488 domain-containing protein [Sporanaerobacter acetigenes]|uniref:DUF488 domain-containing protein n=1 Tax=Sporanaerobacter acetigenes TaxID=165813 RepID=UPI00104BE36D|nr:DUF488 domain-containing protein [Sporanaerobacter acetigenes]